MAITVNKHIIVEGSRNAVIKYHLVSGAAADVTNQVLQAKVDLDPVPGNFKIMSIRGGGSDMDIDLHFDSAPDEDIITLNSGNPLDHCFKHFGGITDNSDHDEPNYTGNLLFSTRGAAADSEFTIILELKKRQ